MYNQTPSSILRIEDDYTAYCLDEAIAEFISRIKNKEKPRFDSQNKNDKSYNPGLSKLMGYKQRRG
ncbi:MAG TPA: hypothetical protein DCM59_09645 [Clostridium sp.]|nr:hypothetical protein [Clostridium sp.]